MVIVELSTVAFYRGDIPREIALRECSVPMASPPLKAFSAFYGLQGKQDGFVAARSYAASQGLNYTVIDLLVNLDAQNPQVMKPNELIQYDFLNFSRISRHLGAELSSSLAKLLSVTQMPRLAPALDSQPLRAVVAQWPLLIDSLAGLDSCRHLKVIAYQAETLMGSRPIAIGSVPHIHWSSIAEATCRLNPTVRITLEPPK